jgi:hypothetical protein
VRQADVAVRNKDQQVAFMVATRGGHDNVKEQLQPVRSALTTQMKEINTAEQFHEARLFVKDYGLYRLKHEMGAPPLPPPPRHRNRAYRQHPGPRAPSPRQHLGRE